MNDDSRKRSDLDKRLSDFLDDRDSEKREGLTLREVLKRMEDRYREIANQYMALAKENSREHETFARRLAEHGHRIGHLEVEVSRLSTEVDHVEEKSGEWKAVHLKDTKEKLQWYERQVWLWLIGALMMVFGGLLGWILNAHK